MTYDAVITYTVKIQIIESLRYKDTQIVHTHFLRLKFL